MKKKTSKILSKESAAAVKAELVKFSETLNVKETQKIVEEVVENVTQELLQEWINSNIDQVVKKSIKEELNNIAKKKL
jgi:cell pole-organizing protein PopZ